VVTTYRSGLQNVAGQSVPIAAGNNSQVVKLGTNEEENISQDVLEKSPLEIKRKFYYTARDQSDVVHIYYIYVPLCFGRHGAKKEANTKLVTKIEMFR